MSELKNSRIIVYSFFIYLFFQIVYLFVFHFLDITFWGTSNGAYKALNFYDWVNNNGELEKGGILYFPLIKIFAFLFSAKTPLEIYSAIVLLNGFFSALLSAFLFAYFSFYFNNIMKAIVVVVFHFLLRGNFVLAVNNEDIFPSYALFVIGALFYNDYIRSGSLKKLAVATFACSVSLLLHWTLGAIALASMFIHLLFFSSKRFREKFKTVFLTVIVTGIVLLFSNLVSSIAISDILYPSKETGTLWVSGFDPEKVILSFMNTLSFIFYGVMVIDLNEVFGSKILSFLFFLFPALALALFLWLYKREKLNLFKKLKIEKNFFFFLILAFIFGTAINIYEQGNDLQFIVQPVFVFTYGIAVITSTTNLFHTKWFLRTVFAYLLIMNIGFLVFFKNYDNKYFNEYKEVKEHITDINSACFIGSPFENFHIISRLVAENNSPINYLQLPSDKLEDFTASDELYVKEKIQQIENCLQNRNQLVLINFINESSEQVGKIFIGYDLSSKMKLLQAYFSENYSMKKLRCSGENEFYILQKK